MLHLKRDYSVYHYLNHSGCTHANTIDDRKEFLATLVRGGSGGEGKVEGIECESLPCSELWKFWGLTLVR